MRYRKSKEHQELMKPGEPQHVVVDLWATSNVFLAGHKLRLEVSSSNFPRFDRNMNTGEEQASATRMEKAANVIYHDANHPSALILPACTLMRPAQNLTTLAGCSQRLSVKARSGYSVFSWRVSGIQHRVPLTLQSTRPTLRSF